MTLIGVQVRSKSTRLPNKYAAMIGDKSVLRHVLDRCLEAQAKIPMCAVRLLCPYGDEPILEFARNNDVIAIEGDKNDLIDRYFSAAKMLKAEKIIRITGDCYLVPPGLIIQCDKMLDTHDYCSNTIVLSYPEGFDVQGCTIKALNWFNEIQIFDREHPFKTLDKNEIVRGHFIKDGLSINMLLNPEKCIFQKTSIDTEDDLRKANEIYAKQK